MKKLRIRKLAKHYIFYKIYKKEKEKKKEEQEFLNRKRRDEDDRLTALEKFNEEKAWTEANREEKLQDVKQSNHVSIHHHTR